MEAVVADDIQLPLDQPHLLQAPPALRAIQADGPIHRVRTPVGDPAWLVTGYAEIRRLFGDDVLGRAHPDPEHAARAGNSVLFGGPLGDFETEAQDHARMRRLLQPHFSPKQMQKLRPRVAALTASLLDESTVWREEGHPLPKMEETTATRYSGAQTHAITPKPMFVSSHASCSGTFCIPKVP
jgi:pentalenolactone synthase